ncbi:hypothetical protein CAPTEDRAFT_83226, partial [Capitella teleta]
MHFNEIIPVVGGCGVYQISVLLYYIAFSMISLEGGLTNFVGGKMDHWCRIPALRNLTHEQQKYIGIPGSSGSFEKCQRFPLDYSNYTTQEFLNWNRSLMTDHISQSELINCDAGWVYDQSMWVSSIVSEWDLVCSDSWKVAMANTVYMAGWLVGALFVGPISDKFGRRRTIIACHVLRCVGGFICCYAPMYELFAFGRFFVGMFVAHGSLVVFVLIQEISAVKYRALFSSLGFASVSLFQVIVAAVAYAIRNHKLLLYTYTWPLLVAIPFLILGIDESPRWLVSKGRDEEAIEILGRILRINKGQDHVLPKNLNFKEVHELQKSETQASYLELFKTSSMRTKTLILGLCWFTVSLITYGLNMNAGRLPGSVFFNYMMFAAVDFPCRLLTIVVFAYMGRKYGNAMYIGCAGMLMLMCIPFLLNTGSSIKMDGLLLNTSFHVIDIELGATGLSVIGKGLVASAFVGLYSFTAELAPTSVRNVALSFGSACARIGGMAAPYVGGPLGDVWIGLPQVFFGFFGLLAGFLVFCLPETRGVTLPDSMVEADKLGEK